MLEIGVDRIEPVQAVNGKNRQHPEVGDKERPIEPAQLMDAGKGIVEQAARETVQPGGRDQERRYRMREKHSVTVRLPLSFYMDGGTAAATYPLCHGRGRGESSYCRGEVFCDPVSWFIATAP